MDLGSSFGRMRNWLGTDQGQKVLGGIGAFGTNISQLANGQTPDVDGAWKVAQDRMAQIQLGKQMRDPALLDQFTPQQRQMLAALPPAVASQLIAEKIFAAPEQYAPDWAQGPDGSWVDRNSGINPDTNQFNTATAGEKPKPDANQVEKERRHAYALDKGWMPGSQQYTDFMFSGDVPAAAEWRPATQEEAAMHNAASGQINNATGKFDPDPVPTGRKIVADGQGGLTIEEGPGVNGENLTEGQGKVATYFERSLGALANLDKNETALTGYQDTISGAIPIVGNSMVSDEYQMARQASNEWINAILRRDSGATITDTEQANAEQVWIPTPGDSEDTLTQKRDARKRATNAMKHGIPMSLSQLIEASQPGYVAPTGQTGDDALFLKYGVQ